MSFYVYQYLREDQTPYYIGKGRGSRAYTSHKRTNGTDLVPEDFSRIQILADNLTEYDAYQMEIALIKQYGRKDIGTGILRNMTDGGDGAPGRVYKHSEESKKKISKAHMGKTFNEITRAKMSLAKSKENHPFHGKLHTEDAKARMSAARKGKPKPKVTCPHCNKEGGASTMKRYHFSYCKTLITSLN